MGDESMPGVRVVRATVVVGFLCYMASAIPGFRSVFGLPEVFWDAGIQPLSLVVCGSACLIRAFTVRVDRGAWLSLSLGLYAYCMGTVVFYAVSVLQDKLPYPSVADPLWLMIYPTAVLAIGLMVRARMAGSVVSMWLDGVVSGLGLISVSAAFAFPVITENASGTPAAVIVNFAYPVLDLLLLAVVIGAIAALGAWRQPMWLVIGAGMLAFTGADSWYLLLLATGSYHPGSPVDVTYQIGPVLMALAATLPPAAPARRSQNRSFVLPALFALIAISVLAIGAWGHVSPLGIVIAVSAVLAAWTRTALAVREVVRLSDSRRQALTDSLTGLPNRRAFYQLLDAAAAAPPPPPKQPGPAVLLVDLDRFKEINDALGHLVGDQVLTAVSTRFAELVPPGGTIARLGGDELALLAPATSLSDAGALAQRLLESLEEPFAIGDSWLHVDASIGITTIISTGGGEPGSGGGGAGGLALAKADVAMYRAKKTRTGWEIYDDTRDGDAWDRLAMVEALRVAIAQNALYLEFQPIVRTSEDGDPTLVGRPTGVEALIRWNHPTRGRVPPDVFLPLAEHAGLMPAVTRTVLELAMDEAVELRRHRWSIPVSINLSASDLLDNSLVDLVAELLAERGLPGSAVRIEITESLLVEGASAGDFLTRLRKLGIDLAVDDYGTGYSSLAYLHDLPVQYLKIDRGFTDRLPHDGRTAVIVASTIEMAHRLGLLVVAEGVENDDQIDWLRQGGCDLLQGYHLSRPIPAARLHEWLARHLGEGEPPASRSTPEGGRASSLISD